MLTVEVGHHAAVDEVAELSFEDAHGFLFGVTALAGSVVDLAGFGLAAKLRHCHAIEHRVDASVPASAESMTSGWSVAFAGRRGERSTAVETRETTLSCESPGVTDFYEELRFGTIRDTDQLAEC